MDKLETLKINLESLNAVRAYKVKSGITIKRIIEEAIKEYMLKRNELFNEG